MRCKCCKISIATPALRCRNQRKQHLKLQITSRELILTDIDATLFGYPYQFCAPIPTCLVNCFPSRRNLEEYDAQLVVGKQAAPTLKMCWPPSFLPPFLPSFLLRSGVPQKLIDNLRHLRRNVACQLKMNEQDAPRLRSHDQELLSRKCHRAATFQSPLHFHLDGIKPPYSARF